MLEYIILGFLMRHEASGYDLKQWISCSTAYFYDASFGSIYPALKRLEQKDMITCHEVIDGSKYKKIYQINESGKIAFIKWLEEPIIFKKSRHDHLVKIFFYNMLPKEKALMNLKDFLKEVEPVLNELTNQKDEAEKKCDVSKFTFQYSTMEYGVNFYQFVIDWCNNLIRRIEEE